MTTTLRFPRAWATDTNYSSGSASGTATKTDPGAALTAQGIIPGVAMAQHINHQWNASSLMARRAFLLAACRLRRLTLEGTAITDTAESMAAVQRSEGTLLVAIKTAQAFGIGDTDRFLAQGVPASITSLVVDAAASTTRIVAIGTGGNRCTYSDDDGATWNAGANIGASAANIIWNAAHSRFVVLNTAHLQYSADAVAAWSAASTGSAMSTPAGLAQLSNGNIIGVIPSTTPSDFVISTDGGATAALAGGAGVPNAATFDDSGYIAGNGGTTVFHAGRRNSGATIQISSSTDGISWGATANITPVGGASWNARARLLMCPNTGLLVLVAADTSVQTRLYASLDGTDWVGPLTVATSPGTAAFALAGGKLFYTRDDMLFASDGAGF